MSIFEGSGVALITPFTENGVDFDKLKELLEWHVKEGTDAILICGTTGEAVSMTDKEKKETIKFTVDVINKRIPVIAGSGSNNTTSAIEMSKFCESVGVDALLVITPFYNKTNDLGLIKHFEAINNAVSTPIMVYNVPGRTGYNIKPELLLELSKMSNIKAIKEASGDMSQIAKMQALCGNSLDFYSGNDDQIIPFLSLGGKGVISVLANILPKATHDMVSSYLNGNAKKALDLQLKYLNLANDLFMETSPIPVKTAMNLMDMKVGNLRLPLYGMSKNNKDKLIKTLQKHNLLDEE